MNKNKKSTLLLVVLLSLALLVSLTACVSGGSPSPATSSTPAPSSSAGSSAGSSAAASSQVPVASGEPVKIGLIAAKTGVNQAVGIFSQEGAQYAVDEINASGGILGRPVELVIEDEVDNLQASVNAATKLMERDDLVAIIGSPYSQNTLAIMPQIAEAKVPFITGGSGDAIAAEGNPYVWQPRNHDSVAAGAIAKYAHDTIGIKNPAILYCTLPTTQAGGFDIRTAYKEKFGIDVPDNMMFGYTEDEKNFGPIIAQVMASGADGILSFSNENPHTLLSLAIADAGCTLPRVASSTVTSSVVIKNAGKAADGWIAVADWSPYLGTPAASKFQEGFLAKYGHDTERPIAVSYDSVHLIRLACENAGTVDDLDAINKGFEKIEGYQGVLGDMTYKEDHGFLSAIFFVEIKDSKATMIDAVKYR
ncbi:ABC transporter substrate-binding protein [Oscillospiraceae bacterium MB08-C2-2]|nr:ABC transporter substrate-binding protein [Oscillospiraceae bacterium MB08-C2-2]